MSTILKSNSLTVIWGDGQPGSLTEAEKAERAGIITEYIGTTLDSPTKLEMNQRLTKLYTAIGRFYCQGSMGEVAELKKQAVALEGEIHNYSWKNGGTVS